MILYMSSIRHYSHTHAPIILSHYRLNLFHSLMTKFIIFAHLFILLSFHHNANLKLSMLNLCTVTPFVVFVFAFCPFSFLGATYSSLRLKVPQVK